MTLPFSRREFLKQLAVAGSAGLASVQGSQSPRPFSFTAPETLPVLLAAQKGRRLSYIGSATSHFQAEPLLYDTQGSPLVLSDWEYEVTRRLKGQPSGIPHADVTNLPRFLANKTQYLHRSAALSENMFRFSLDFGRLCPKAGEFNYPLMAEYMRALALIKAQGQEPFLTLHHFTMPRYLIKTDRNGSITAGGWEHPDVIRHFRFFISNVVAFLYQEPRIRPILEQLQLGREIQDRILHEGLVRYVMTINEPAVTLFNGYLGGTMPPYKRTGVFALRRVLSRLVEAHDLALNELKQASVTRQAPAQVCIGHNWQYFDGIIGRLADEFQREWTASFERDGQHSDFLSLHYYFRQTIPLGSREQRQRDYGDQPSFGDIYPQGILKVLELMHSSYPSKQILIGEIGFSDQHDRRRPYWILETIRYIIDAVGHGLPVRGVLLWSLVNNFEWEYGMSQKFGLFGEDELSGLPIQSSNGIKSWEAWQAVTKAILAPSPERLKELQRTYELAYKQYKGAGGHF
jgi:beta-glucosidase